MQDAVHRSNKIVFHDDDDDGTESISKLTLGTKQKKQKTTAKTPLFDDNDSDGEADVRGNFEIKQQFEGKKGEKLRRLQDRFHGDNRFKMDAKFLEDDSDGDENDKVSDEKRNDDHVENIETNESDERQWQLNILESIVGKRIQTTFKSRESQKK